MKELLIAHGVSQKLLNLQNGDPLKAAVATLFRLNDKSFLLQEYNRDWNDWIDVDDELSVCNRTKLRIQLIPSCSCFNTPLCSPYHNAPKICHCGSPRFIANEHFESCNHMIGNHLTSVINNLNESSSNNRYQNISQSNPRTSFFPPSTSTINPVGQIDNLSSNTGTFSADYHTTIPSFIRQNETFPTNNEINRLQVLHVESVIPQKNNKCQTSLQNDYPSSTLYFQEQHNNHSKINENILKCTSSSAKSESVVTSLLSVDSEVSMSSYESDNQEDSSADELVNFESLKSNETDGKALLWKNEVILPEERFTTYLRMQLETEQPITKKAKHDLLDVLADYLYQFTAYPTRSMREQVAYALVTKYPHLKEDIGNGILGWATKLCNKLKKIRFEMNRNKMECFRGKRRWYSQNHVEKKRLKKSHSGQVNWAPDFPLGEDEVSLMNLQNWLLEEYNKHNLDRDHEKINEAMNKTFVLRRQIINGMTELSEIKKAFPLLFEENQLFCEFRRLMQVDLRKIFIEKIYQLAPKIIAVVELKKKKHPQQICFLQVLNDILKKESWSPENINHLKAIVSLKILPYCLLENPNSFYREIEPGNMDYPENLTPYILSHEGKPFSTSAEMSIMHEGNVLIPHIPDFIQAVALLFATYYCCNIQYPSDAQLTFLFLQHSVCEIPTTDRVPTRLISFVEKFKEARI